MIWYLLVCFSTVSAAKYPTFFETVLQNRSYERLISPFEVTRQITDISVSLPLVIVVSVDESKQVVSYIAAVNVSWFDERLAFDPIEMGYDSIVVPSLLVWIPWVETFNSVELKFLDRETPSNQVRVHYTGEVYMLMKGRFDTVCRCDVSAFPFDEQYCNIDFHTGLTPVTEELLHGINRSELVIGLPEWNIGIPSIRGSSFQTLDGRSFSIVIINFTLTRNPQFYIWFLIVPTMTITLTCIVALLLPIEIYQGERVNLGIAGLLGLTFMLSIIVVEVPRSTNLPLLGKWLIMQMFFSIAAMAWEVPGTLIERWLKQRLVRNKGQEKLLHQIFAGSVCILFVAGNLITSVVMFATASQPGPDPNKFV